MQDGGLRGMPRPNRNLAYLALAALVAVALVRSIAHADAGPGKPLLPTSCVTPEMAIEKSQLQRGGTVTLEVTGPPADRYAAYLDVTALRRVGAQVLADTRPGVPLAHTEQLLGATKLGSSCRGTFSTGLTTAVPIGTHVVTLFRIAADGSGTALLSRSLVVTAH